MDCTECGDGQKYATIVQAAKDGTLQMDAGLKE